MRITYANRALGALALGLALTLSACGSDDTTSEQPSQASVSTTEHDDADVTFASDMLQHHAQALSMVDMTMGHDLTPEVAALAEDIRAAQAPEIETMSDWLQEWGEDIPETVRDHANAHGGDDMGGGTGADMPGMMTADDMAALEDATGAEFQAMWLEMMIEHHEGAVEMAQTQQADGQYKPAVDLAGEIITAQNKEIEAMQDLLG